MQSIATECDSLRRARRRVTGRRPVTACGQYTEICEPTDRRRAPLTCVKRSYGTILRDAPALSAPRTLRRPDSSAQPVLRSLGLVMR
jgi:hypothetical protein